MFRTSILCRTTLQTFLKSLYILGAQKIFALFIPISKLIKITPELSETQVVNKIIQFDVKTRKKPEIWSWNFSLRLRFFGKAVQILISNRKSTKLIQNWPNIFLTSFLQCNTNVWAIYPPSKANKIFKLKTQKCIAFSVDRKLKSVFNNALSGS